MATPGHRLPRDRALDLLWPEAAPDAALNALYVALHGLRRVLEPDLRAGRESAYVETRGEEIRLRPHPGFWVDADAFEIALAAAEGAPAVERGNHLRAALALYSGDLLVDELTTDWPVARREALRAGWRRAVLDHAEIEREAGRPLEAVPVLEQLLASDPIDEAGHRALIRALAAAGRPEEASRQFERCAQALRDELGVEPAAETRALAAEIRSPDAAPLAPPPAVAARRLDNLPAPPNPLVGRARELEALQDLLWDPAVRLVTVTGAGGIGKTRLALEAAQQVAEDFGAGAAFVPLAPLRDPALVLPTIARALGIDEAPDRPILDLLREALRERDLLLLLDNVEQVLDAAPDLAELLAVCPDLKLLVTSREPLHLRAEHELPAPPLATPPLGSTADNPLTAEAAARYEAVTLLVQRARAVNPAFALSDDNAAPVAALCARLDGLPLAIELAAARSRHLSPVAMLAGLTDRFALLAAGYRDLPPRQRTMRDAIAWSYDLLSDEERALFRRLAVFTAGCTPEAAEIVCRAPGDLGLEVRTGLEMLVAQSLLRREESDGELRFSMLETIRDFGLEILAASGEADAVQRAHAIYFRGLAERAAPELDGPDAKVWLDLLETEHANLRAALTWCRDRGDGTTALRIAVGAYRFWESRGHFDEGRSWFDLALAMASEAPLPILAEAYRGAAALAGSQDDSRRSEALHRDALAIQRQLGDARGMARSLERLGWIARMRGDEEAGERLLLEALAMSRDLGDTRGAANALNDLGMAAAYRGDHDRAHMLYEQALAGYRCLGDGEGTAHVLNSLADLASRCNDHQEARRLGEEACGVFRRLGDVRGLAATLLNLGDAYTRLGDLRSALAILDEAVILGRDHGLKRALAIALFNQANALHALGRDREAAPRWTQSLALLVGLEDRALVAEALAELAGIAAGIGQAAQATLLHRAAERLRDARAGLGPEPARTIVDDLIDAIADATGTAPIAAARASNGSLSRDQAVAAVLTANLGEARPSARPA